MNRTVADELLDVISAWGVSHLFSCPGSTEGAVLDALLDRKDVELVLTTHEATAVSIADGIARATRQPSLAYLHANGGLTNGLAHLAAAQLAYSPLVILNGLKPTSIQAREGFTTARRMRDFVHQYVKHDWQSLSSRAVPEDLNRAFRTAVSEPAGPVWLGLSQDLLEGKARESAPRADRFRFDSRAAPPRGAVVDTIAMIVDAERPLLVAGSEVARADAVTDLARLSELTGVPVVHEDRRSYERCGFPTDHPNFRGKYSPKHPLVRDADVIVFLGARVFNEFEPASAVEIPSTARVIHSHADARRVAVINGVDVGLVCDQRLLIQALIGALPDGTVPRELPLRQLDEPSAGRPERIRFGSRLKAMDVVEAVAESLRGSVIVSDVTTAGGVLQTRAHQSGPDDFFESSSGSLGWGMGAALGIKMGLPDRRVAAILGDGVFQFGIQSLWTAARRNIPVTYVVLNNERYAAVGAALQRYGGVAAARREYPGTDIAGVRIAEVSTAFGVPGQRVETLAELRTAVDTAGTVDHPVLIEVMTDPTELAP